MNNTRSGMTPEELLERVVKAIAREWRISETEARAALDRARTRETRLGKEMAHRHVWDDVA